MSKLYSYRIVKWKSSVNNCIPYYKIQFRKNTFWGRFWGWDDVNGNRLWDTKRTAIQIAKEMMDCDFIPNQKVEKEKLPKVVWVDTDD